MNSTELKRPRRLTFILIANILIGTLTTLALFFLTFMVELDGNSLVNTVFAGAGGAVSLFLVVASIMVFMLKPNGPKYLLASVVVFYGVLALQSIFSLFSGGLEQQAIFEVITGIFRNIITIALNFWAVLSEPSRQYLIAAYAHAREAKI
jgi:hypothetical protein